MTNDKSVEALKSAILLERRGKAFYRTVADQAGSQPLKDFFEAMVREETKHLQVLGDQLKAYQDTGKFDAEAMDAQTSDSVPEHVLSSEIKNTIAAAGFEAAAIAAAMAMEERAVKLYAQRAAEAADPGEKALYEWLADWERTHVENLAALDKELTETIWHDNNFWPF